MPELVRNISEWDEVQGCSAGNAYAENYSEVKKCYCHESTTESDIYRVIEVMNKF